MAVIGVVLAAGAGAALAQMTAPPADLVTRKGWEVGGLLSNYKYEEPDFMWLRGDRIGASGAYTMTNSKRVYARFEGRASYGELDYEGSGTMSNVPDYLIEVRALVGRDYALGSTMAWSPYFGVGLRYLYNDLRGTTSTGQFGYRRESTYMYIPVGVTLRMPMGSEWVLVPQAEYKGLLRGVQRSYLSDTGLPLNDISNQQRQGRGYRVQVMFEGRRWSIGPWLDYWDIKDSDLQQIAPGLVGMEPANWTREAGVEVRYRF